MSQRLQATTIACLNHTKCGAIGSRSRIADCQTTSMPVKPSGLPDKATRRLRKRKRRQPLFTYITEIDLRMAHSIPLGS
jgi:hypothetical protein